MTLPRPLEWTLKQRLTCGDSAVVLKEIEADTVDLVATDPPYGLAFMGKDWDRALPPSEIWAECLRVLKPGAFAFVLCTPRQDCLARMICSLEDAGFAVGFTSIYWAYASGFPKAQNLSKAADKRAGVEREVVGEKVYADGTVGHWANAHEGYERPSTRRKIEQGETKKITLPATPKAKALDGAYGGFQPKPAVEVVLVVMKPPVHKTWLDQALDNGHGCTWLDDGRIPTGENLDGGTYSFPKNWNPNFEEWRFQKIPGQFVQPSGRFPANLAISDNAVDDGRETSGSARRGFPGGSTFGGAPMKAETGEWFGDSGSFSRYFSLDAWWEKRPKDLSPEVSRTFPFLLTPKASSSEKNRGLKTTRPQMDPCRAPGFENPYNRGGVERRNNHPTVKPLKLMAWLIALGSSPGDLVVDPFMGSGTTPIAAKIMGRRCLGIEQNSESYDLACARVDGHRWSEADLEEVQPKDPKTLPGQLPLWGTP